MNIKEFAKSISGKEYGYPQFTKEEIETAKENGEKENTEENCPQMTVWINRQAW